MERPEQPQETPLVPSDDLVPDVDLEPDEYDPADDQGDADYQERQVTNDQSS